MKGIALAPGSSPVQFLKDVVTVINVDRRPGRGTLQNPSPEGVVVEAYHRDPESGV